MTRNEFITNVEATQKELRRFLVALCCGDQQLADDIAQDSYMKAYISIDSLTDQSKFRPWIFSTGYHTFLNNRRGNRPTVDYSHATDVAAGESADSSFRYEALYRALDMLRPMERSSILLFYMENYSVKEIAEIEGISIDAVKQHLSRGRNHLREKLETLWTTTI